MQDKQDKAKNAHVKSLQAAFGAWVEDLRADEAKFDADRILKLDFYLFVFLHPESHYKDILLNQCQYFTPLHNFQTLLYVRTLDDHQIPSISFEKVVMKQPKPFPCRRDTVDTWD